MGFIIQAVSEISAIIQLSMDSLVVPTTPSLGEIFSINRQVSISVQYVFQCSVYIYVNT